MSHGSTTQFLYNADHRGDAEARLLRQWQRQPRMVAFARAMGAGAQVIEDANWAILVGSTLDNSAGHRLDQWGDLVGQRGQARVVVRLRGHRTLGLRVSGAARWPGSVTPASAAGRLRRACATAAITAEAFTRRAD